MVPRYGFDFKGAINKKDSVSGRSIFTGMHTQDDALFFVNKMDVAENVNIIDVAPTILQEIGWKGDKDFDGKIL